MKSMRVYGVTCVFLLVAMAAGATTIVMPADEQLIAKTPLIVDGTVLTTTAVVRDRRVLTETIVRVARHVKGNAPETITVTEIGGEADGRITKLFGTPEFDENDRVLLFLEPSPLGGYRTVDLFVGHFRQERTLDGRRLWFRGDREAEVNLLGADFQPLPATNVQRDAAGFENYIAARLAGRETPKSYGIANPVLARETSRFGDARPNFELIDEPTVYRWFTFDSNGTATWYHQGTQPGYTGGGVNEIRTAMTSWTGYANAKIRYSYSGAFTGTPGGLDRSNNRNEILLNDPLNEISGSWNRNTGGVVGIGGFNGVTSGGNWTPPFAADAEHTAGVKRAYNIVEGNLTIQDGVSSSAGISSNRLAEIIAHEFGHTLGFGHSPDPTALMYASVTGLGPSLRTDDQTAARWLYPGSGGGTPTPTPQGPSAPSGLTTSVSGTSVSLFWNDNASNETSQQVWLSAGTAAFAKVADLGANENDTRLSGLAAGSYRAYIVAVNANGSSSPSNTAAFNIVNTINPSMYVTPLSGTAGVTNFTFYDETTGGAITSRQWSFGDGETSTAIVARHVYARSGQYTVTLTINGTAQTTQVITVVAALSAGFDYSPSQPSIEDTISFADTSTGSITGWLWEFGDGTTSTAQNPLKKYSQPRPYNVRLTVSSGNGSLSITKAVTVTASAPVTPSVSAQFEVSPATPLVGVSASFADRSTGSPTSWSWSFGDGGTSTQQNPTHTYSGPGDYDVTLRVTNAASTSQASRRIRVTSEVAPFRSLISATAQTNGVGGTTWRTELSLFNAGSQATNVSLVFLPGAGGSVLTQTIFLGPKQSVTFANALLDLFGLANGAGALTLEASSSAATPSLKITSRTFTGGGALGTYGQSVPDVAPSALGEALYLTGIQANAAFRTNVGVVNRADVPAQVALTLYEADGDIIGNTTIHVPARNFQQAPLAQYFASIANRAVDVASMKVTASAGNAISVYASVIDNRTQDPVYIQAGPAPAGTRVTLAAVGRAPGANGTFWRSDVAFFNPNPAPMSIALRFLAAGADNRNTQPVILTLGGGDTVVMADLLSQLGLGSGNGALEAGWSGGTGPIVTSRTYTSVVSGGTFGQSIDPIATFGSEAWVPGLRADAAFRSNAGFVNDSSSPMNVVIKLLSPAGFELGTRTITLPAKSQIQYAVGALFPNAPSSFTLHAQSTSEAKLFVYGSMVDNLSGDPVFFAGR